MKFGVRKPSIRKSIAARTSVKRMVRHNLGLKASCGWGWLTNPKRAAYNRVYSRSTVSFWSILGAFLHRLFRGLRGRQARQTGGHLRALAAHPDQMYPDATWHQLRIDQVFHPWAPSDSSPGARALSRSKEERVFAAKPASVKIKVRALNKLMDAGL
jgi:hypothetical protein